MSVVFANSSAVQVLGRLWCVMELFTYLRNVLAHAETASFTLTVLFSAVAWSRLERLYSFRGTC